LTLRSGQVLRVTTRCKRQFEYLTLLEQLDRSIPPSISTIHLLADNVLGPSWHLVQAWLAAHPRFSAHFTPVHCSWMNPWSNGLALRRKRLRSPNFADLAALQRAITTSSSNGTRSLTLPPDCQLLRQDPRMIDASLAAPAAVLATAA